MINTADIKGLIFDKDGTLFDFAATWEGWAQAFLLRITDGDRARASEIGVAIGYDLETSKFASDSVVIAGTQGEITDTLLPYFPDMIGPQVLELLNDEAQHAKQHEVVALVPLLNGFRQRGLKLGLATNDAERPARAHLEQAGITEMFDLILGFDSGHGGKPAPGQLLAFAALTGLDCSEIVMVGDSTHDLDAGRAAGMTTVGVLTGPATADDLRPFADIVIPDIGHLSAWLDGQATSV